MLALLPSLLCMGRGKESLDTISVERAFVDMPPGVLDLLPRQTRQDMLLYHSNDSTYRAPNNLRGTSYIESLAPGFLSVRLTAASTMQFKVLRLADGREILMTIYTTGAEGDSRDSEIAFYDSALRELKADKFFPAPKLADYFDTKGYRTSMKEIEEILPFRTYLFEADPEKPVVTGRLTYGDRLTVEDIRILELLLRPEVTYQWDGKQFRVIK